MSGRAGIGLWLVLSFGSLAEMQAQGIDLGLATK